MKNIFNLAAVTLTAAAQTGGGLREIDLFARAPFPENVAIGVTVTTNGTAPGSGDTVTAHYALADEPGLTVADLGDADATQDLTLPDAANTKRQYTLPVIVVGQRYLYLWFDNTALAGGAALNVQPKITW